MLTTFLYECVLWIAACALLPKMLYQLLCHGKYRHSLWQRFGGNFPVIDKGLRPLIWLHAVSVGEMKAAARLARAMQKELDAVLVVSVTTETGYAEAMRSLPEADFVVYLPLDFYMLIAPIVKRVKPNYVLISESDLWLNFLRAAKKMGAVTALINGKLSARSAGRLAKVPLFTRTLFNAVDLVCVQSALYQQRFEQLKVDSAKIKVTGNLKFDANPAKLSQIEKKHFRRALGIALDSQVLVIGSSHDPEEIALLQIFKAVQAKLTTLQLIIVPRHPERFNAVAQLLRQFQIPFCRYSDGPPENTKTAILIDSMGMLEKCYQIADLAIVAGSYTVKVGGHNILEPLWFDVPVVFGPHMASQPELLSVVQHYGAAMQLPLELLEENLPQLLNDISLRRKLQQGGQEVIAEMHGSTARTLNCLLSSGCANKGRQATLLPL